MGHCIFKRFAGKDGWFCQGTFNANAFDKSKVWHAQCKWTEWILLNAGYFCEAYLIKQSYKLPEVDWNWHNKEEGKTYYIKAETDKQMEYRYAWLHIYSVLLECAFHMHLYLHSSMTWWVCLCVCVCESDFAPFIDEKIPCIPCFLPASSG